MAVAETGWPISRQLGYLGERDFDRSMERSRSKCSVYPGSDLGGSGSQLMFHPRSLSRSNPWLVA